MLQEMAGLGFEWVELSHGIKIVLVPGILKAVAEGVVKIASVHNFCPLPTGVTHAAPNHYMPSATDARERDMWLRQSKRTIDFAHQVQATQLVLHLGAVEFFWFNPARPVDSYAQDHLGVDLAADPVYRKNFGKIAEAIGGSSPTLLEKYPRGPGHSIALCGAKRG